MPTSLKSVPFYPTLFLSSPQCERLAPLHMALASINENTKEKVILKAVLCTTFKITFSRVGTKE